MNHLDTDKRPDRADAQIFVQRADGSRYVIQEQDRGAESRLWVWGRLVAFTGNSLFDGRTYYGDDGEEPRDANEYVADLDAEAVYRLGECPGGGVMGLAGDFVSWAEDPPTPADGSAPLPTIRDRAARILPVS
jgi:hypothetical protein